MIQDKIEKAEKPVFTQAMADAGELPSVGSEFKLSYYEPDSRFNDMNGLKVKVIGINDGVYTFWSLGGYGALRLGCEHCKPIDTRTNEQKAIDEMISIAIDSDNDIAKSIIYEACLKLYQAGYTKNADA